MPTSGSIPERGEAAAYLELLEPRCLLSANAAGCIWRLAGDGSPDSLDDLIVVRHSAGDSSLLEALINGQIVDTRSLLSIKGIVVNGGRGDDTILLDLNAPGDEAIRSLLLGGPGKDTITGGAGPDRLIGGPGRDAINGAGGQDRLSGQGGMDVLLGGDDDDVIKGGSGDDTIDGGGGVNRLCGGSGADTIYAQPGLDKYRRRRSDVLIDQTHAAAAGRVALATLDEDVGQWFIEAAVRRYRALLGTAVNNVPIYQPDPAGEIKVMYTNFAAASSLVDAGQASFDSTNVQVAGVDESDLVKTDGHYIYVMSGTDLIIVDAADPAQMQLVDRYHVDGQLEALYLVGNQVVLAARHYDDVQPAADDRLYGLGFCMPFYRWDSHLDVTVLDVSDPSAPAVLEQTQLDGDLLDSRLVDDRLCMVVRTDVDLPPPEPVDVDGVAGQQDGQQAYESEAAYRARLAGSLESVLPQYVTQSPDSQGQMQVVKQGPMFDPTQTYLPPNAGQSSVTSVMLFNLADGSAGPDAEASIFGFGGEIYADSDSLYMVWQDWTNSWREGDYVEQSLIAKFSLDAREVSLAATGTVPGHVINHFAMDEYEGNFRIATTRWENNNIVNSVFVLVQLDDLLTASGKVEGLGGNEQLQAVRFVGDEGYVVTFRRVDPLFTLDLSDPAKPQVTGELVIPGYSVYLQPLENGYLIGLGYADAGNSKLQLSLFDIRDPANPVQAATYQFDDLPSWWRSSEATYDAHAFSYFPDYGLLALPVQGSDWTADLYVLSVDKTEGFDLLGVVNHEQSIRRSLRIDDVLFSVSDGTIKANRVDDPSEEINVLNFQPGEPVTWPWRWWGGPGPLPILRPDVITMTGRPDDGRAGVGSGHRLGSTAT